MDLRGNPPEGEDILLLDIGEQLTINAVNTARKRRMLAQRVEFHRFSTHPLQHPLEACAQSYIPVLVACWKCDRVSLPGWQLEVLVPPAGVQKISVCFACSSLCSYELDTILSSTVPLVWAESLWIAGK